MKLNDFQYNWYLHFEEENEKSIIGLPFDPYFEAHKYDSETILDYVPKARRTSKIETSLLGIVSDCFDPVLEIPKRFKPFGRNILKAIDELFNRLFDNRPSADYLLIPCWIAGVCVQSQILEVPIEFAIAYSIVLSPLAFIPGALIIIPVIFTLAALRYLVDLMPQAYTFMFITLVMSTSRSSTSEAAFDNEVDNTSVEHHDFTPDDQPTAEQLCSVVEQQGYNWSFKYELKGEEVYLVESHRNGKLDNPVMLNNIESVLIVKDIHAKCMKNFK